MQDIYNLNNKKFNNIQELQGREKDINNIHDLEQNNIKCNEVGFDCIPNPDNENDMNLADFIKKDYRGARIVIRLRSGIFVAGEVVDGFDNVIGLRTSRGRTFYVNAEAIDFFF